MELTELGGRGNMVMDVDEPGEEDVSGNGCSSTQGGKVADIKIKNKWRGGGG